MIITGADGPVADLTRWNRGGLDRVRYVDGAAAEWVEYLRICHLLLTAQSADLGVTLSDDPLEWRDAYRTGLTAGGADVTAAALQLRAAWHRESFDGTPPAGANHAQVLRAQYDVIALDQTRQISRAFARAFHILTESLNAYANEGLLATATQPKHLRRLLDMIGFAPAPAASALVQIGLILEDGAAPATLGPGLTVEHTPADGGPVLTFEALETLTAAPALNLMRAAGWDARSDPLAAGAKTLVLPDAALFSRALAGTIALLEDNGAFEAVTIDTADKSARSLGISRGAAPLAGATLQTAQIHAAPDIALAARPTGATWIHFTDPPKAWVGQTVALQAPESFFGLDAAMSGLAMKSTGGGFDAIFGGFGLGGGGFGGAGPAPSTGIVTDWFAASPLGVEVTTNAKVVEVRGRDIRIDINRPANLQAVYPTVQSAVVKEAGGGPGGADILAFGAYVVPEGIAPIGSVETLSAAQVHFDAEVPKGLAPGLNVAVVTGDGETHAAVIDAIDPDETGFALALSGPGAPPVPGDIVQLRTGFAATSALAHDIRSDAALFDADGVLTLDDPDGALRDLIRPGRRLLIGTDPALGLPAADLQAAAFTVATVSAPGAPLAVTLTGDRGPLDGLARGDAAIRGNVVQMGHGKSLPQLVLGSGDSAAPMQVMTLTDTPLSTIPDPGFPGGVALDLEITVAGRVWRQVAEAEDAPDAVFDPSRDSAQPAYTVGLDDAGLASVRFLQRLPTGADNVVLTRRRVGAGAAGNLVPARAIAKLKTDIAPVTAVVQPLPPQFGADLQGVDALRDQGDSHFALADRAVSVDDFAKLAEGFSGVWHAAARLLRIAGAGGRATVEVTVVPAGGGGIGALEADLTAYLAARALPGTALRIAPFVAAPVAVAIVLTLKPGFAQSADITDALRVTLTAAFGLEARGLGERLFTAEITAAAEAHPAVASLTLTLTPLWAGAGPRLVLAASGAVQAVLPDARTSVHIAGAADLTLSFAEGGA